MSLLWCGFIMISQVSSSSVMTTVPANKSNITMTSQIVSSKPVSSEVQNFQPGTVAAVAGTKLEDTTYVCNGEEVARIKHFNENNPYIVSECTNLAGMSAYYFPFNGELSYAQMVVMSSISQCQFYFRAVLLVQLQECVVANVYIRTTAETILQLASTSGKAPTEAEVRAAIAVRKTYNLALRDGDDSASRLATNDAMSLSWHIDGNNIDTTMSATKEGQLLLSPTLHVIGTYSTPANFSSSSPSTTTNVKSAYVLGHNDGTSAAKEISSWLVVLVVYTNFVLFFY
ncbi:hypothetical protein Plhal304r1_c003g0010401 [Plasmopara halstedii]